MSLEEGKISGPVKSNPHALVLDQLRNWVLSRRELVTERPQIKELKILRPMVQKRKNGPFYR